MRKIIAGAALALVQICAHASAQTRVLPPLLAGVTIDNTAGLAATEQAIAGLPAPVIARVVFDKSEQPAYYAPAIQSLDQVGYTMGELMDSSDEQSTTVAQRAARTDNYLSTLGASVDLWEIGNEVNGNWLGPIENTAAKIYYSWKEAHAKGYKTALTLYYDDPCSSGAQYEMFNWAAANIPADMTAGLDYVLVSYYPGDCNGVMPSTAQWISVFQKLSTMFPHSKVGFGEVGTVNAKIKSGTTLNFNTETMDAPTLDALLTDFYGLTVPVRMSVGNFIGGYFDWYFKEQSPKGSNSWTTLSKALKTL